MKFLRLVILVGATFLIHVFYAAGNEAKIRYEMPELMMVTWAEWPDDPKQQDVMAQFIKANGFNSVEVEMDKLEMCRRNGLYARLGDGDINRLLKNAAKLKDDKSVFAYFISDRRRRNSFPAFANRHLPMSVVAAVDEEEGIAWDAEDVSEDVRDVSSMFGLSLIHI